EPVGPDELHARQEPRREPDGSTGDDDADQGLHPAIVPFLALEHTPRRRPSGRMSAVSDRPRLRAVVDDLPAYVPGASAPVGAAAFKLSSNENPYPPLPSVLAAIHDAAADVNRYPDMFATELTAAIAHSLGVEAEQVVAGAGSVAVLAHILEIVAEPGTEVVFPWRSFE